MAVNIPDGAILSLSTTYGTTKTVSGITNANPAVATSTAHALTNGMVVTIVSGWSGLTNRTMRINGVTANTFNLEGIDTTSTTIYPPGSGGGTAQEITGFTQVTQIMELTTTGGDQNFTDVGFLENTFKTQIPTDTSPVRIDMKMGDDPTLLGQIAVKNAAEVRGIRTLRMILANGSIIFNQGFVSFQQIPSMVKGQVMQVSASFALQGVPVRYSS